jgi:dTDP-4-amino-4,6-dideoxygalactose transaminase
VDTTPLRRFSGPRIFPSAAFSLKINLLTGSTLFALLSERLEPPPNLRPSIPLVDLKAQRQAISEEIETAIAGVVERCDFILGEEVARFESEFAEYCGVPYAIGVASGADALHLACRALDIGAGDEVIVPAMTFAATAFAVSLTGARPVIVDVRANDALIDPDKIECAITSRTKAIIPVHLYGQCADMAAVCAIAGEHSLAVIEDAAQAHGAVYAGRRAGSLGDVGCFSFYPGKNLGAYGDGGLVTTSRRDIAEHIQLLHNCGSGKKYHHESVGLNSRLDTLQAAVLRAKLTHLDEWNAARRRTAAHYDKVLQGIPEVHCTPHPPGSVHHLYVIRLAGRDNVLRALNARGIGAGIHYPFALHELEAYASLGYRGGAFPVAENWARQCLSLPIYAELTAAQVDFCVAALKAALQGDGIR